MKLILIVLFPLLLGCSTIDMSKYKIVEYVLEPCGSGIFLGGKFIPRTKKCTDAKFLKTDRVFILEKKEPK
jgi:hypothetical protein